MFQPKWISLIFQLLKNKFIRKTSSIDWDVANNAFKIIKGGPYTNLPTFDQNHSFYAVGDASNGSSIRLYRDGAACEVRLGSYGGSGGVSTQPSGIAIYRSQGSLATPLVLANGNYISKFASFGFDGSSYINSANIFAIVDGVPSTGSVPQAFAFFTGTTSAIERLRIASSGNIGIGTATPGTKLQVTGGVAIASSSIAATDPGAGNLSLSGNVTAGTWQGSRVSNQYLANNYTDVLLSEDFIASASTSLVLTTLGLQAKTSGIGASVANTVATTSGSQAGAWSFGTGTIAGNYSLIYSVNTAVFNTNIGRNQNLVFRLRTATLPTVSEDYNCFFGFGNSSTGAEPTDGAYFFLSSANANYQLVTQINGVRTSVDSGIVASTSYNIFRINLNSTGTQASFYINDIFIAAMTITTGRTTGINANVLKNAGTTSSTFLLDKIIYYTYA